MGLSSSQGRLLMLTSRLSDIELQQMLLSQRQNRLAFDQEKVAKAYTDALNNYKLEVKVPDLDAESENATTTEPLTLGNLNLAGFIIADAQGNIYLTKNSDGEWNIPKDIYGKALVSVYDDGTACINEQKLIEDAEEKRASIQQNIDSVTSTVQELDDKLTNVDSEVSTRKQNIGSNIKLIEEECAKAVEQVQASDDTDEKKAENIQALKDAAAAEIDALEKSRDAITVESVTAEFTSLKESSNKELESLNAELLKYSESAVVANSTKYNIIDGGDMLKTPKVLEQQIMNGRLYAINTTDDVMGLDPSMLQSDTQVEWVLDTSDDAQALAEYEYQSSVLERKESQIEMEIKQLDTQHEAILKEIESIDKVISGNIDRTFKLFSDG